jgi:hypothetical protein
MELIYSSETSLDFQRATRSYIAEPPLWEPQILHSGNDAEFYIAVLVSWQISVFRWLKQSTHTTDVQVVLMLPGHEVV